MPHPFPFFGAGAARYHEFAGIEVRFTKKPSPLLQKEIIALAPPPLSVRGFKGKMLAARSPQYVNEAIQRLHGKPKDVDKAEQKELGKAFYVTRNASRAFETAVEEWLLKAHDLCPIEFVYRAEDLEGGGTKLAAWHKESLAAIPALLRAWNADKTIPAQPADELNLFAYCAQAIIAYGAVKPKDLPASLRTLFPYEFLRTYFSGGDQRSADELIAGLPDSVPALAAVELHTHDERRTKSVKERAPFLHFIRNIVDAKSIGSSQHALLIFQIFRASLLLGDERFGKTFAKLVAGCDDRLSVFDEFGGYCNGVLVGNDKNPSDPGLAAKLANALLTVPLTKSEQESSESLERLRELAKLTAR